MEVDPQVDDACEWDYLIQNLMLVILPIKMRRLSVPPHDELYVLQVFEAPLILILPLLKNAGGDDIIMVVFMPSQLMFLSGQHEPLSPLLLQLLL